MRALVTVQIVGDSLRFVGDCLMYSKRTVWSVASILLFISVLIVMSFHGSRSRVFAQGVTNRSIDSPEQALDIWQGKKVTGRILLLFDKYPHLRGRIGYEGEPQLIPSNVIEMAVFRNIIRKIYLIVPDDEWEEFRQRDTIRPIRAVPGLQRGMYLFSLNGVIIIATTLSSLPNISEKPLVYINNRVFDYAVTLELLSRKKITSDITISLQGRNDEEK